MGGPQPYIPIGLDEKVDVAERIVQNNPQKRARVLCSYDAADATELNLTANEVRFHTTRENFFSFYFLFFLRFLTQFRRFFFLFVFLQVIFVTECNPSNADYMFGKQGLTKGLVPRAFLEVIED